MFFKNDDKVVVNNSKITTYVGADTKIEGTVITKTSVRVDGSIVGGVCADGTVVVSKSGYIKGNVIAQNAVIAGEVEGNLQIKDKTNIEPTGSVLGDISTARILIDEQSRFQGNCNMNIGRDGKKSENTVPEVINQEKEEINKPVNRSHGRKTNSKTNPKTIAKPTAKTVSKTDKG